MGTPIEPVPPAPTCAVCWGISSDPFGLGPPPGNLTVSVSGIFKGDMWEEGDPEPPSGLFIVPKFSECTWALSGDHDFYIKFLPEETLFRITTDLPFFSLFGDTDEVCASVFPNLLTDSALKYYGGSASLVL